MLWTTFLQWMLRLFSKSNTPRLNLPKQNPINDSQRLENSSKGINPAVKAAKENAVVISLDSYFTDSKTGKDRRFEYPNDYNNQILENAKITLERVNALLKDIGITSCSVSSGWRPPSVNVAIGGAKNSAHCTGEAVDLVDKNGNLKQEIMTKLNLLEKHNLYMEDRSATPTWMHLQTRPTRSGNRVFKP